MSEPSAAAIYARISSDAEGTAAGVKRQVADCRALAESLGWTVAGEYVDNDISASGRKRRPEYERMLADLRDGLVDAVVIYNVDRLTRHPADLEHFYDVVKAAKVAHVRFVTGEANLLTDDGLMQLRILGAFAAKESANTRRRVKRKMQDLAAEGKPNGGAYRPFGYEPDKITVRRSEAALLRTLVARFLAGESTRSLASWLNDREVATVTGGPWSTTTLKGMLTNPRYAGLRAHLGNVVSEAVWEAILTEDEYRRILAKYAAKKVSGRRTPQRYLLSGMLRCGRCQTRLYSSARKDSRRYVCSSGPDHGGCGRLTIVADPVERLVADFVLYRLDSPELADRLAGRASTDHRAAELSERIEQTQARLDDLAAAYGQDGGPTMREWMIAKKPLQEALEVAQRQLGQMTRTSALTGLVGQGEELRQAWGGLNLSRQHAIVEALVDHVVIGPGKPGARGVDPDRVDVMWRP